MRLKRGVVVLWRGPGTSQVGLAQPLVFHGLSERDQHSLALLEGPGLGATAKLSRAGQASLAALELAGFLESKDGPELPTVAIKGLGTLGLTLGLTLARAGYAIVLHDDARVLAEPAGTFGTRASGSSCAVAAADSIRMAVPGASVRIGIEPGDITVVIGVAAADPAAWVPLMAADKAHVLVTADEAGVDVGPLVVPGRSACGECLGLSKAHVDPAWPRIALQAWSGRRPHIEPDAATVAAGLVASAIAGHARGDADWALNAQLRCESGRAPVPVAVRPHPDCGCGAAAAASPGNYSPPASTSKISAPYLSSLDAPIP